MTKYIEDLSFGDKVEGIFVVRQKKINSKKDGSRYIFIELGDRTGQIAAFVWDDVENSAKVLDGEYYIKIGGIVNEYCGRLQVIISGLSKVNQADIKIEDLFPSSPKDLKTLKARFAELIGSVANPWLKKLLDIIFSEQPFYDKFITAPAAISKHHNYLNGLLDHTVEVCELAIGIRKVLPELDHDLILSGALIHDIGKVEEYKIERGIEFTEKGILIGHVVIGHEMASKVIETIDGFPEELRMKILHMILSHHGREEWGSPKKPATKEAYLLHTMDNLSSKMNNFEPGRINED